MDPFIGEIRMFAGNFAPTGWAFCNGQLLPIAQYSALFSLLGTTFGGNGSTTFALPDLRGRVPVDQSQDGSFQMGQMAGEEHVTVLQPQMPSHTHSFSVSSQPAATGPGDTVLAQPAAGNNIYGPPAGLAPMAPSDFGPVGGSQPHDNMQPYLCVTFIIALQGIYPARS